MFWLCMMNGAAGHTYGANGIWQVNRQNDPHGPSPHHNGGFGYGKISWDEAMNLGGSRQVGLGKKLLEQFPWQNFQPHPEWATFSGKSSLSLEGCQWIWYPEGNPAQDAPVGKRFFRRTFVVPEGKKVKSAQLRISADDQFTARLNGEVVGVSNAGADTWKTGKQFDNIRRLLKAGTNILAITAENMPATTANPAGMIARLEIRFDGDESLKIVSDATWLSAQKEVSGWDTKSFDDQAWQKALVIGKYGDGPWGPIDPLNNSDVYGPQSAGIPGVVRIIYVPECDSIVVNNMGRHGRFTAAYFDPVTGAKTAFKAVKADEAGRWICPPPAGNDHDWVLILKSRKNQPLSSPKAGNPVPIRLRTMN
jgi:hypothetical protein